MAKQALEGIKVADFSWVGVVPMMIRYLAVHGATVVHIESKTRVETMRHLGPFPGNVPNPDASISVAKFNAGKYGVTLNLNCPKGIEIAKRFIAWADIAADSFTPGRMAKWGLGYEDMKKIKPDIILMEGCMQGQTGPHAGHPGYGHLLVSLAGYTHPVGWPDRPPGGGDKFLP